MARRSSKTSTPLNQKQQDLARQESQLREQMQKLERMIEEAPRVAEETSRRQREEILHRASEGSSRLNVAIALQDKRYGDDDGRGRPRRSMRKERREGRIIFIVLVIALAAALLWLVTHLPF